MDRLEVRSRIRFALDQLASQNGHHEFEHIAREFARRRICRNIKPATGPVSAGGDGGIDFETYEMEGEEGDYFVSKFSNKKTIFACSIQKENITGKIKSDINKIVRERKETRKIVFFCTSDVNISAQNREKQHAQHKEIELEIFDGNSISEELTEYDLRDIAIEHLKLPREIMGAAAGLPHQLLKKFLEKIGQDNVPINEIEERIEKHVNEYNSLLERMNALSDADPRVMELRSEAMQLINEAKFDLALLKLSKAEDIDQEAIEKQEKALRSRKESRSDSIIIMADIEKMNENFTEAETAYMRALNYTEIPQKRFQCINNIAKCLSMYGNRHGDITALEKSISILEDAANDEFRRESFPYEWAKLQQNAGTIYDTLGKINGDSLLIKKAIDSGKVVLEFLTKDAHPEELGDINNNIGNYCASYAELTNDLKLAEEAEQHLMLSLEQRKIDEYPDKWSKTMNNIGLLYKIWGERLIWDEAGQIRQDPSLNRKGRILLNKSIIAHNESLKTISKEKDPYSWANTNMNLGNIYYCLGSIEKNINHLYESINNHNRALEVFKKDKYPQTWASEKNNLAATFYELGCLKKDTGMINESINLSRECTLIRTRENAPRYYAETIISICYAMETLGKATGERRYFEMALDELNEVYEIENSLLKRPDFLKGLESFRADLQRRLNAAV